MFLYIINADNAYDWFVVKPFQQPGKKGEYVQ